MPFLPPNQQHQSTEGSATCKSMWRCDNVGGLNMSHVLVSYGQEISIDCCAAGAQQQIQDTLTNTLSADVGS